MTIPRCRALTPLSPDSRTNAVVPAPPRLVDEVPDGDVAELDRRGPSPSGNSNTSSGFAKLFYPALPARDPAASVSPTSASARIACASAIGSVATKIADGQPDEQHADGLPEPAPTPERPHDGPLIAAAIIPKIPTSVAMNAHARMVP